MTDARPLVAWDVDDVLNSLMQRWFDQHQSEFVGVEYGMLRENPPHRILGISREEYLASLDQFRQEEYADLEPRPEVLDFLREHGERFRHIATTATPRRFAAISAAWVMEHFGDWIRGFTMVPSSRADWVVPTYATEKGELLSMFNGRVVLVDDSIGNLTSARIAGFDAIAFPAPWNDDGGRSVSEVFEGLLNWEVAG